MSATNHTTHYEMSQYIGSDKPTYLVDYNQDMSKIDTAIYGAESKAGVNETNIGTLANLTTTEKSSLVGATNEVNAKIGTLSSLTTTDKTDVVSAVNEVKGETAGIGTLSNLNTSNKTNLVSAINEVNTNVGNLNNLTTTATSSLVSAINEVDSHADTNASAIGDLSTLTTSVKTDVVSAINSIEEKIEELDNYSTNETLTGQKWIDGKDVYRKVLQGGSVSAGGTTNLATGISNLDKVIDAYGFAYDSSGDWFPLSRAHKNSNYSITYYWNANGNQFSVETGSDLALTSFIVIVEYTKSV